MIELTFKQANEIVLVRISGKNVQFGTTTFGAALADISGLRLDYIGTVREFPDLKDDLDWRKKAIQRFKDHISSLSDEEHIAEYIIFELKTKGYTPMLKQKAGFRAVRI